MGADADGDSLGELAAGAPAPSNGFAELRVPACVSVTGPATLILPAGTTTLHLCVVSCAPQVIAVAYTLSDPLGWTAGLAGSATLAPGDSLFLDATITSPAMSCGETNVVTLAIRETACAMPFLIHTVAVSRPAVPVTPVITQCIVPAHIVQVGDSLFTGICFKNPSTEPQAFEYAIHFSPAWCPALQATVVLGPGDSLCAGLSCRVPAGLPCGPAGFAQALVRDACAQTSYDGCSVSFAIRNDVCVGRTCAPDTVVTPGAAILRRFRFGNCGPAAETFAYSVTDARGWATSVAGVVTLQPQENSAWLVVPVLVPSTPVDCLLEDELMLDVRAESCAGDAFTCKSSVFVTEDPLAAPTLLWSTGTRIASLAFPGDLNADGYGDFVVGTLQTDVTDPGRALVYFGGPALDTAPDRTFTGEAQFDGCGAQVTGAGDFNGDGRPDLAVAAYGNDGAGPDFGRVYVFFGGPGFDVTPDRILNGQAAGGGFGTSMAGLGDVNGDGYDDLAVGAPSVATGRVYLYFGGPAADTVPDLVIDGPGNSYSARRIAGGVDLDGDGWKDFCIAAENTSIGQYAASVYRGGPALDAVPDLVLPSAIPALDGGLLCADLNRDGFGDIAYGAPDGGIQVTGGRVSIYFGGPGLDAVPDRVLQPGIPWDYFGLELALAGDLDGDGSMDLAGSTQGSRVWLYHAGANLDESCDAALNAPRHLVGGRDVTGDGHADLLVGDQFNWLRLYTTLDHLPTDAGDPVPQAALPQQTALTSCVERGAAGTRITYDIGPRGAPTRLDIFDVAGRRVRTLVDTYRAAGSYITTWDHRDARGQALVRGVYLVRLHAGDISFASKIAILRP
jgi:hypothetical protein